MVDSISLIESTSTQPPTENTLFSDTVAVTPANADIEASGPNTRELNADEINFLTDAFGVYALDTTNIKITRVDNDRASVDVDFDKNEIRLGTHAYREDFSQIDYRGKFYLIQGFVKLWHEQIDGTLSRDLEYIRPYSRTDFGSEVFLSHDKFLDEYSARDQVDIIAALHSYTDYRQEQGLPPYDYRQSNLLDDDFLHIQTYIEHINSENLTNISFNEGFGTQDISNLTKFISDVGQIRDAKLRELLNILFRSAQLTSNDTNDDIRRFMQIQLIAPTFPNDTYPSDKAWAQNEILTDLFGYDVGNYVTVREFKPYVHPDQSLAGHLYYKFSSAFRSEDTITRNGYIEYLAELLEESIYSIYDENLGELAEAYKEMPLPDLYKRAWYALNYSFVKEIYTGSQDFPSGFDALNRIATNLGMSGEDIGNLRVSSAENIYINVSSDEFLSAFEQAPEKRDEFIASLTNNDDNEIIVASAGLFPEVNSDQTSVNLIFLGEDSTSGTTIINTDDIKTLFAGATIDVSLFVGTQGDDVFTAQTDDTLDGPYVGMDGDDRFELENTTDQTVYLFGDRPFDNPDNIFVETEQNFWSPDIPVIPGNDTFELSGGPFYVDAGGGDDTVIIPADVELDATGNISKIVLPEGTALKGGRGNDVLALEVNNDALGEGIARILPGALNDINVEGFESIRVGTQLYYPEIVRFYDNVFFDPDNASILNMSDNGQRIDDFRFSGLTGELPNGYSADQFALMTDDTQTVFGHNTSAGETYTFTFAWQGIATDTNGDNPLSTAPAQKFLVSIGGQEYEVEAEGPGWQEVTLAFQATSDRTNIRLSLPNSQDLHTAALITPDHINVPATLELAPLTQGIASDPNASTTTEDIKVAEILLTDYDDLGITSVVIEDPSNSPFKIVYERDPDGIFIVLKAGTVIEPGMTLEYTANIRDSGYNSEPIDSVSGSVSIIAESGNGDDGDLGFDPDPKLVADPGGNIIPFDEAYYLHANQDVLAAVEAGIFASGYEHFVKHGAEEGRSPTHLFDKDFYLANNADVAEAVVAGSFPSGLKHFLSNGQFEGRQPSKFFDEQTYLANNPDVAEAVASGQFGSAFEHYVSFGLKEGRQTTS